MSLLYISGMFLNDAFDNAIDARERPNRPIPSKQVYVPEVFAWGILLMLWGLLILFSTPIQEIRQEKGLIGVNSHITAICLCLLIVFYDWKHKENPFSPFVMGMCRGMLYITAGLMYTSVINTQLAVGAAIVFAWTIGLTFLARQEALDKVEKYWPVLFLLLPVIYGIQASTSSVIWITLFLIISAIGYSIYIIHSHKIGRVGIAVSTLIASLSLLDGLLIAISGYELIAPAVSMTILITLFLQKYVPGT
tara:strand:- start:5119 stop:5868 length:750 start_codon:yes stop_codon:yes gene_type:complete